MSEINNQAVVSEFKDENKEMLSQLQEQGWTMSDDPDLAALTVEMFRICGDEVKQAVKLMDRVAHVSASDWTSEYSLWEAKMPLVDRVACRSELVAMCMARMVTDEFMFDTQRRWERAEFSSVSKKFLSIGDLFVCRRGDPLELMNEVDIQGPSAAMGRSDVTYQTWDGGNFLTSVQGVRPKINGDRFQMIVREGKKVLVGFKELLMPGSCPFEIVEYYAGKYYVLAPLMSRTVDVTVEMLDNQTQNRVSKVVTFYPHPYLSPHEFAVRAKEFFNHKYEGIMLWNGVTEFRAKWFPTAEIELDGEIWECRMARTLTPTRPRPGKMSQSVQTVPARLRSCIRGSFIIPMMQDIHVTSPEVSYLTNATAHVGCKCLFVLPNWRVAFIREPDKRLDLIGGTLELGEEPIGCMVREVLEETDVKMRETDFFYLGPSKEQSDTGSWLSHVYIAACPDEIAAHVHVEVFNIDTFLAFKNSGSGRPRAVWMARHLDFLRDCLGGWQQAFFLCQQLWGISGQGSPMTHPIPKVWAMIKDKVSERYRQRKSAGISRKEEMAYAEARQIYLNKELLDEHWPKDNDHREIASGGWRTKGPDGVQGHGSTTQKVDVSSWNVSMPVTEDDLRASLLYLFSGQKKMPITQFYNIIRGKGYKGARKPLVQYAEACASLGLVSLRPLLGGGREVIFIWDTELSKSLANLTSGKFLPSSERH